MLLPKQCHSKERKAEVGLPGALHAGGLSHTFGITRWLKKLLSLPAIRETLSAAKTR